MSIMQSFSQLGVSRAAVNALSAGGIEQPFPIQEMVIGDVLAGHDVLVRSPTGSGKTLAFGIPIIDRIASDGPRPAALILAPTRELANQITTDLRPIAHARALRVTAVYGGVGLVNQGQNAARSHIVVATPGRLEDQLSRGAFSLDAVRMLVLDEADRMLDMGFKPAVDRIVAACPRQRQTMFFSATLAGEAGAVARRYTNDARSHENGPSARHAAIEVEHRFVMAGEDRMAALTEQLNGDRGLTIVFVRTKRGADRLVKRLTANGSNAVAMHGNKSQRQRESALSRFQSGAVDTLVATDVAARGIDVKGVTHVINFDPPEDRDAYVHRVGRTARAGRTGIAITLVDRHQEAEIASLADALELQHELKGSKHNGDGRGHGGGPRQGRPSGTAGRHGHDGPRSGPRARKPRHEATETNQRRRRSRQGSRRAGTQPTG
ncbi:MAG: DEAD/DEAH box helicase [Solirubrobacteraceae bacterium]